MTEFELEKKAQEVGYYPQMNRCAVCGYAIMNRRGGAFLGGVFLSMVFVVVSLLLVLIPLVAVGCVAAVVFGVTAEAELRRFHRKQRLDFLAGYGGK